MNCNYCKIELKSGELLTNRDEENVVRLEYFYCVDCRLVYNSLNQVIMEIQENGNFKWVNIY